MARRLRFIGGIVVVLAASGASAALGGNVCIDFVCGGPEAVVAGLTWQAEQTHDSIPTQAASAPPPAITPPQPPPKSAPWSASQGAHDQARDTVMRYHPGTAAVDEAGAAASPAVRIAGDTLSSLQAQEAAETAQDTVRLAASSCASSAPEAATAYREAETSASAAPLRALGTTGPRSIVWSGWLDPPYLCVAWGQRLATTASEAFRARPSEDGILSDATPLAADGLAPDTSPALRAPSTSAPPSGLGPLGQISPSGAAPALATGPDLLLWLAIALAALALPLWLLYRRLDRAVALESPTRRAILDRVVGTPGMTALTIAKSAGVSRHTALHHLAVLHEFGFVEARRVGARTRYFKNGGAYSEGEKRAHVALGIATARLVASALLERPASPLRELAKATGLPKTTVHWHLDRLRSFDLIGPDGTLLPLAREAALRRSAETELHSNAN